MKRAFLAIICGSLLFADAAFAVANPAADQDMASRYLRAAQSGDDAAQFFLGSLYSSGTGVARSDQEAFRWFSLAAAQGHSHAMLILSGLYATGRGVEKNNTEAYKWAYIVSGASQVEEFRNGSRQLMGVLEAKLSPAELSRAKSDATRWRATPGARLQTATSSDNSRATPAAAPAPAAPSPPARVSSNDITSSDDAISRKSSPRDNLLRQVPSGLRKRFGF